MHCKIGQTNEQYISESTEYVWVLWDRIKILMDACSPALEKSGYSKHEILELWKPFLVDQMGALDIEGSVRDAIYQNLVEQ